MAEDGTKISDLNTISNLEANDLVLVVHQPATAPDTVTTTVQSLFTNVPVANVSFKFKLTANTLVVPANTFISSTVNVVPGSIAWDSNYLYVATSNTTVKRISLQSF